MRPAGGTFWHGNVHIQKVFKCISYSTRSSYSTRFPSAQCAPVYANVYSSGRSYVHGKDQKLRVCQCTRLHGRASALPMYLVSTVVPVIVMPVSMVVPVIVVLVSTVPLCFACLLLLCLVCFVGPLENVEKALVKR